MGTTPLSIRFEPALLERLRRQARARETTPSGLAQRLVDEGLRSQEFPGIVFRDGPSGRRAGLSSGPDVWEVVAALRETRTRGDDAIAAVATDFAITPGRVRIAVQYYGRHTDEIDDEVSQNEQAADEAFRAWQSQQRLLA